MAFIEHGKDTLIPERNTIYSIQVLRGVAAVLVVLFHATQFFTSLYQIAPFWGFFLFGFSGVDIFFVLSGFIIFMIHFPDIGKPQRYLSYIIKRFIRIYPIYWITLAILSCWLLFTDSISIQDVYENISLLYSPKIWVNPVCWTMTFEVLFYIIFSFLILNRILGSVLIFCWMIIVVAPNLFDLKFSFFLFILVFHKYTILFMIGLIVSYTVMQLRQFSPMIRNKLGNIACLCGFIAFSVTSFYCVKYSIPSDELIILLGYGFASGCFMICALSDTFEAFFRKQNLLKSLGDASYSIYLLHYIFLSVVVSYLKLHTSMSEAFTVTLAFVAVCVLTVIVGWLFYMTVEHPLLKFIRTLRVLKVAIIPA
jgi:peptidoglycan/LPS O-acetylase OafA/YrhL